MCVGPFATIISQIGAATSAGATATALSTAGAAAGVPSLAVGGQALAASAQATLTQALSSAAFLTSTAGSLLQFGQMQSQAKAMAKAGDKTYRSTLAAMEETKRRRNIAFQQETSQIARRAAVGIGQARTTQTAQGLAGDDPRLVEWMNKSQEMTSLEMASRDTDIADLDAQGKQARVTRDTAFRTAQSAFSPEAYAGLGLNIGSGFLDAYGAFGALPFESNESYSARVIRGLA